jgi:hypothetical protein
MKIGITYSSISELGDIYIVFFYNFSLQTHLECTLKILPPKKFKDKILLSKSNNSYQPGIIYCCIEKADNFGAQASRKSMSKFLW